MKWHPSNIQGFWLAAIQAPRVKRQMTNNLKANLQLRMRLTFIKFDVLRQENSSNSSSPKIHNCTNQYFLVGCLILLFVLVAASISFS